MNPAGNWIRLFSHLEFSLSEVHIKSPGSEAGNPYSISRYPPPGARQSQNKSHADTHKFCFTSSNEFNKGFRNVRDFTSPDVIKIREV